MPYIIRFYDWVKKKKVHYLFPFLTFAVAWWLGMLTNPVVGAIFFSLTLYLVLVIFVPWEKIPYKKVFVAHIISAVICLMIVVPLWNNIKDIFPSPFKELIRAATATVEVYVSQNDNVNTHYMDSGGYVGFGKENTALLVLRSEDSYANQIGNSTVVYRATLNMDATSTATQQEVRFLKQAEYVQISLFPIPDNAEILKGVVIITINNKVRIDLPVFQQRMSVNYLQIRDLSKYMPDFYK